MKDKILQAGSISLYVTGIVLWIWKGFPYLFALILALHCSEYFITARKIAAKAGIAPGKAFLRCMLFGFTWWLPIKKQQDADQ